MGRLARLAHELTWRLAAAVLVFGVAPGILFGAAEGRLGTAFAIWVGLFLFSRLCDWAAMKLGGPPSLRARR